MLFKSERLQQDIVKVYMYMWFIGMGYFIVNFVTFSFQIVAKYLPAKDIN